MASYRTTVKDHWVASLVSATPAPCSGAMYAGRPEQLPQFARRGFWVRVH